MSAPRAWVALLVALPLGACTTALVTANAPKSVRGQALAPYAEHEECLRLEPGDRIEFAFESTDPIDFNVHYHEGKAVVMPIYKEKSRAEAGVFAPPTKQDYCLMWEAGAAGAVIDYRIRLTPGP